MLRNRQKALLYLCQAAGGRLSDSHLQALSFLVQQETKTGGGSTFYAFLPHGGRPYSFTLAHEAMRLHAKGFFEGSPGKEWHVNGAAKEATGSLGFELREDVYSVAKEYGGYADASLKKNIRARYPRYARKPASADRAHTERGQYISTIGYEGLSADEFLALLLQHQIKMLIDVRSNPVARKFGFHASTLRRLTGEIGIEYQHEPTLGIASTARQSLDTDDDYRQLFLAYEGSVLQDETETIGRVGTLMKETPSALMCMEADPCYCHRSRLSSLLSKQTDLPERHIASTDTIA
ncbi:MAG: DUF488 domain-containing protein [Verrucomicrobia bacterium]|jgi:hypothetical protein|nr:DUF488 domain-containing protein [Verrucomicrobiota bacterium]MBT7065000.1 DUF488 domain-containing protein [Verrucomicrobiota bacterium]MBT7700480.1 DUF488 domain-containing protein [Verrucomicrobiota bacterium]